MLEKARNYPTEKQITADIRGYLQFKGIVHWKVMQGLGCTPGVPDIVGILPGGRFLGIEVKTAKGKLSDKQAYFKEMIEKNGGLYILARSIEDVDCVLRN